MGKIISYKLFHKTPSKGHKPTGGNFREEIKNAKEYDGDILITNKNKHMYSDAVSFKDTLRIADHVEFIAPNLENVGSLLIYSDATLTAPKLISNGDILFNERATLNIPQLEDLKYKSVEYNLFVIYSTKTYDNILIEYGYLVLKKYDTQSWHESKYYVASKYGYVIRAKSVKEAVKDLKFKIAQDILKYEPITLGTSININRYMAITGTNEFDVIAWLDRLNIKENSMRAGELLPILKHNQACGADAFEKLLNK